MSYQPDKARSVPLPQQPQARSQLQKHHRAIAARKSAGDRMRDGSVYIGQLPGGAPLFAAPEDAPLALSFSEAEDYVAKLNSEKAHGHGDWRMPTKEELWLLYGQRHAGALKDTFNYNSYDESDGAYWSSTLEKSIKGDYLMAHTFIFYGGYPGRDDVKCKAQLRPIRSAKPA